MAAGNEDSIGVAPTHSRATLLRTAKIASDLVSHRRSSSTAEPSPGLFIELTRSPAGLSFESSCAEVVELGIVLVTISGVVEHRDSLPKRYSSENGAQRSWLIDTSISCR
jgi:hypothetical protein